MEYYYLDNMDDNWSNVDDPENITLSEVGQKEKDKYYMMSLIYGL